jgi:multiple sugar transport system substrate-binding protein
MWKTTFMFLAVLTASFFLYGCKKDGSGKETAEPVALEFLQFWETETPPGELRSLLDRFEAENPGITVVLKSAPFSSTKERVMSSAAAGTLADVVSLSATWISGLWRQGALADLDQFMADYGVGQAADVSGRFQVDGRTVMLPVADSVYGLAVNDGLLARFGVTEPVTWDEFRRAAESASSRSEGIAGYAVPLSIYSPELVQQHVFGWLWCGNGGSVAKDGFPDVVNVKHRETITFLKELYDGRWLLPESFTENTLDAMDEFASSRLSFLVISNAQVAALKGRNPALKFSVIPYPVKDSTVLPGSILYNNPWGVGISARTAYPQEAWKLIQFLEQPDINSRLSALAGFFPANSKAAVDRDVMDEQVRAFHDLYRNAKGFVHEMAGMRVADNLMSIYMDEFQSYMHDRIGTDEMMENVQKLWMENY